MESGESRSKRKITKLKFMYEIRQNQIRIRSDLSILNSVYTGTLRFEPNQGNDRSDRRIDE